MPSPILRVADDRRYLQDALGHPMFLLGDTPWFLQKLKIDDVRHYLEDRRAKGYNTLFIQLLDDGAMPSVDAHGNAAFLSDTDITRPNPDYWDYADQVRDEVERVGFYFIDSNLWYGAGEGLWLHHINPENVKRYAEFLGKRFAKRQGMMWMHAGDRNPDERLLACTRTKATTIRALAPHHLHTVHHAHEFSSAYFHAQDDWLDVNMAYTYGPAHLHVQPEVEFATPTRPVILGETGYEGEPNQIERLPDGRSGDLWDPYKIRRNLWWSTLAGATGYCGGSRIWRYEPNWREAMQVRSAREAPIILKALQNLAWWTLRPDSERRFVTGGYGAWHGVEHVGAAMDPAGSCGMAYLPVEASIRVDLSGFAAGAKTEWFDPTDGEMHPATITASGEFRSPGLNADGEPDWVLIVRT
jgi:hypothetical protein